jgi:hypothetical protein
MPYRLLDGRESLAPMDLTALVEAGREYTRARNIASVDRIDTVFAMLCRIEQQDLARREADDQQAAAGGRGRRPEYSHLSPERVARSHVSTALDVSSRYAARLVDTAIQLHTRLFRLSRAAGTGRIDETLLVDLACRLRDVPDHLFEEVENRIVGWVMTRAEHGDMPSRTSVNERIDRALESLDPDETDRQHEHARQDRRVSFRPRGQGMSSMWAMLPTEDAEALRRRLENEISHDQADDPRTTDQRLADALTGLAHAGTSADTSTGSADTPADGTNGPDRPAPLHITVIGAAALGLPARVEFVRGAYAAFDWLCHQVLAQENETIRFTLVDPVPGAEDDPDAALRYTPSEALRRRVRMRDRTCRFPGCTVPAENCELDHVIPFNHADPAAGGPTAEWNLADLCKGHHLEKTFGLWTYRPGPDGELIITTDTGHEYRTYPDGILAQARDDHHDVAARRRFDAQYPGPSTSSRPRDPAGPAVRDG